jgi:hypothetical protein
MPYTVRPLWPAVVYCVGLALWIAHFILLRGIFVNSLFSHYIMFFHTKYKTSFDALWRGWPKLLNIGGTYNSQKFGSLKQRCIGWHKLRTQVTLMFNLFVRKDLINFLLRATPVVHKSRMRLVIYSLVMPELLTSLNKPQIQSKEPFLTSIREVGVWDLEVTVYTDASCWNLVS